METSPADGLRRGDGVGRHWASAATGPCAARAQSWLTESAPLRLRSAFKARPPMNPGFRNPAAH
jgi:hypothetical protein